MGFLNFIPSVGEGISWITQKAIVQLSTWGLNLTVIQTKVFLIIVFGFLVYLLFSVITIAKKVLKWGLIALTIFLAISVAISMFV